MTSKPSNPKDAFGIRKASLSCISAPVLFEVGVGMQEGACKYGRHNYRVIGVRGSVYYDATLRHMMAWWEGEDIDPDSGLSHITKAITSLVVLRDAMLQGKFNDDRPPKSADWLPGLNARAEALFEKYPEPVLPYTERDNSWMDGAKTEGGAPVIPANGQVVEVKPKSGESMSEAICRTANEAHKFRPRAPRETRHRFTVGDLVETYDGQRGLVVGFDAEFIYVNTPKFPRGGWFPASLKRVPQRTEPLT
ncbi:hypothetical protein ABIE87_006491 [Bradyrhizobium diazoefficiens]|jgi:hypothetical protein|uniref:dATP/dGTP diphosphohydrolase domain-containing protein n=1 Tax=Bradyrhizobium diazoefficiens TaxID=1355477 RepID=UPI003510EF1E